MVFRVNRNSSSSRMVIDASWCRWWSLGDQMMSARQVVPRCKGVDGRDKKKVQQRCFVWIFARDSIGFFTLRLSPALSVDTAIGGHYSVLSVHFGTFFSSTSRDVSDIPVEVALPPEWVEGSTGSELDLPILLFGTRRSIGLWVPPLNIPSLGGVFWFIDLNSCYMCVHLINLRSTVDVNDSFAAKGRAWAPDLFIKSLCCNKHPSSKIPTLSDLLLVTSILDILHTVNHHQVVIISLCLLRRSLVPFPKLMIR